MGGRFFRFSFLFAFIFILNPVISFGEADSAACLDRVLCAGKAKRAASGSNSMESEGSNQETYEEVIIKEGLRKLRGLYGNCFVDDAGGSGGEDMSLSCKQINATNKVCGGNFVNELMRNYRNLIEKQNANLESDWSVKLRGEIDLVYQKICRCKNKMEKHYSDIKAEIKEGKIDEKYAEKKIDGVIESQKGTKIAQKAQILKGRFEYLEKNRDNCFNQPDWLPSGEESSTCEGSAAISEFDLTVEKAGKCVDLSLAFTLYKEGLEEYEAANLYNCGSNRGLNSCNRKLTGMIEGNGDKKGLFQKCQENLDYGLRCCGNVADCKDHPELGRELESYINRDSRFQSACRGEGGNRQGISQEAVDSMIHAQKEACKISRDQICKKGCEEDLNAFKTKFKECFIGGNIDTIIREAKEADPKNKCQEAAIKISNLYNTKLREHLEENTSDLSENSEFFHIVQCKKIEWKEDRQAAASAVQQMCQSHYGQSPSSHQPSVHYPGGPSPRTPPVPDRSYAETSGYSSYRGSGRGRGSSRSGRFNPKGKKWSRGSGSFLMSNSVQAAKVLDRSSGSNLSEKRGKVSEDSLSDGDLVMAEFRDSAFSKSGSAAAEEGNLSGDSSASLAGGDSLDGEEDSSASYSRRVESRTKKSVSKRSLSGRSSRSRSRRGRRGGGYILGKTKFNFGKEGGKSRRGGRAPASAGEPRIGTQDQNVFGMISSAYQKYCSRSLKDCPF